MVKKVGDDMVYASLKPIYHMVNVFYFFICMLCITGNACASDSSIILRIQDMNHEPIKQAMCQAPFVLQVELKNIEGYTDMHLMQYIPGIENFKSSKSMTSRNVVMDNGKKTVKTFHNFVLRSDKKGNFTVGPISLKDKTGQHIRSNRLVIPVGDELVNTETTQKDKYFITMTLNKKTAYVGEKVLLNIKFYDRVFVDDLHLQFPEFKNISIIKSQNNFKKNMIELEGEEYLVTEWSFDIYPLQAGSLIIQDIHAAFFAPELESKFKLGGAFDFFRSLHKSEKYIVAKPLRLDVLPLPLSEEYGTVDAVGQFSSFRIMLNQDTAPVGQGVVLSTELVGDANFEMMSDFGLTLPEGFKYYDSYMVTIDPQRTYKRSEFVVQGDTPGIYTIPSQTVHYFDPMVQQYKTIQSNELSITITPAPAQATNQQQVTDFLSEEEKNDHDAEKKLHDFLFLSCTYEHATSRNMILSFQWYGYLLWLLCIVWFCFAFYRYVIQHYIFTQWWYKKFIIFYQAKRMYKKALSAHDVYKLSLTFKELFAHLLQRAPGTLQDEMMIGYLRRKNALPEEIESWKSFYMKLLHATFSPAQESDKVWLFAQALVWIEYLKEKA